MIRFAATCICCTDSWVDSIWSAMSWMFSLVLPFTLMSCRSVSIDCSLILLISRAFWSSRITSALVRFK